MKTMDLFLQERGPVLASWPTGRDISLEDGIMYQKSIPLDRRFSAVLWNARKNKRVLIQPRAGVALIDEHIRLLKYLENEGGADLLPTTIDAYTRQNRYEEASKGIEKSLSAGHSLLNGFPAVNHGLKGCRQVTESVAKPIQVRHGTPDARLLAEISLAAGFTSFEGGGVSYNIPYAKKVPLDKSIRDWQYVDRLVGYYEENGVRINREPFGPLTGTLVPPFISHSIGIIEGLLALEQGAKSITLGYGQGGNVVQDIAAVETLRELADKYFSAAGFSGYELTIVFHQWMGGFPEDEAKAFSVINFGTTVACMAGADKIIVKTPHEAMGIPTQEANAQGLKATRQILNMLEEQNLVFSNAQLSLEKDIINQEVNSVMQAVFELGHGNAADGCVKAFASGILDVPFAPSVFNRGKILPVRDNDGFIRVFAKGNLPLSDAVAAYHKERLEARAKAEKRALTFQMVTDDIYAISKGRLIGRPR